MILYNCPSVRVVLNGYASVNTHNNVRPYARTSCAFLVKMAKDFGFKCSDTLTQLGVNAKLSDICCASCTGKQKPKPTTPKTTTTKSKKTCGAPSYTFPRKFTKALREP